MSFGDQVGENLVSISPYIVNAEVFEPLWIQEAGTWIRQNTPEDSVVMSSERPLLWYADRDWKIIPFEADLQSLINRILELNIKLMSVKKY